MSRRGDSQLFIGRLSKDTRTRDLEDIFEVYGRLARCDVKYGAEMAYAFIDYEDKRDAEDAIKYENGREIRGSSIIVEWAKGAPRRPVQTQGNDECYRCFRTGHWARDCPSEGQGRRGYGGGGGGGGYRRSPRRRYSRSRSRSPRRRRSRSRDRRRSRSRSRSRRSRSRSRSRSHDRRRSSKSSERQVRGSKSRSASPDNWE